MTLAAKFTTIAETVKKEIVAKERPRDTNTPKKNMQATAARIDADHLKRVHAALLKLAEAHEKGAVPASLAGIKSKAELMTMLKTKIDHSGGYYSLVDTGEFHDQSATAKALRAFLMQDQSAEEVEAAQRLSRQRTLEKLEADVKFTKIPGFFPTPPEVAARMIALLDLGPSQRILEPSAGKGCLVEAVEAAIADKDWSGTVTIDCVEFVHKLQEILTAKGKHVVATNFLEYNPYPKTYDRIIMNPPFEKDADSIHVQHAFDMLRDGGVLVALMSSGTFSRSVGKAPKFRAWLDERDHIREPVEAGAFKKGFVSTGISSCIVRIRK